MAVFMDRKGMLEAYMDACALVRETEGDIRRLCRQEAVGGSAGDAVQREKGLLQQRRECTEALYTGIQPLKN